MFYYWLDGKILFSTYEDRVPQINSVIRYKGAHYEIENVMRVYGIYHNYGKERVACVEHNIYLSSRSRDYILNLPVREGS